MKFEGFLKDNNPIPPMSFSYSSSRNKFIFLGIEHYCFQKLNKNYDSDFYFNLITALKRAEPTKIVVEEAYIFCEVTKYKDEALESYVNRKTFYKKNRNKILNHVSQLEHVGIQNLLNQFGESGVVISYGIKNELDLLCLEPFLETQVINVLEKGLDLNKFAIWFLLKNKIDILNQNKGTNVLKMDQVFNTLQWIKNYIQKNHNVCLLNACLELQKLIHTLENEMSALESIPTTDLANPYFYSGKNRIKNSSFLGEIACLISDLRNRHLLNGISELDKSLNNEKILVIYGKDHIHHIKDTFMPNEIDSF